jgi:hypothetical protein
MPADIIVYTLPNGLKFKQYTRSDNTIMLSTCFDDVFPMNEELPLNPGFRVRERLADGRRLIVERV